MSAVFPSAPTVIDNLLIAENCVISGVCTMMSPTGVAQLTTLQRLAATSTTPDGGLVFDTDMQKLYVIENAVWVAIHTSSTGGFVNSVTGTSHQINSTGGSDPVISISENPIIPGIEGVTVPSGTTGERPVSPNVGEFRFNTTAEKAEIYTGTSWTTFTGGTGTGSVTQIDTSGGIQGGPITTVGEISLEDSPVVDGTYFHPAITVNQKGIVVGLVEQSAPVLSVSGTVSNIVINGTAEDPIVDLAPLGDVLQYNFGNGFVQGDGFGRIAAIQSATNIITSVSGTTGNITVTAGDDPVIDLEPNIIPAQAWLYPTAVQTDTYGRVVSIMEGTAPTGGTVTSITAGDNLLGGTITDIGTIDLNPDLTEISSITNTIDLNISSDTKISLGSGSEQAYIDSSGLHVNTALIIGGMYLNEYVIGVTSDASQDINIYCGNGTSSGLAIHALSGGNAIVKLFDEQDPFNPWYVGFEAPTLSSNLLFMLPSSDGSPGQFMKTDGTEGLYFGDAVVSVTGTMNQIGASGTTAITVSIANNPILPGNESVTLPIGTTAQRPSSPANGMARYNSDTSFAELYVAGAWKNIDTDGGTVTSVGISTTSAGITLGGTNPVTTTGTISVDLDADLNALAALSSTGYVVRTGTATYASNRSIAVGSANLTVSNADGVAGNTSLNLATTITGLTSLTSSTLVGGNISITGNTISSTTGAINLSPNSTNVVSLTSASQAVPLRFYNSGGTQYISFKAGTLSADTTFTLPTTAGSANQFLQTNGTVGTPTLTFASAVTSVTGSTRVIITGTSIAPILDLQTGVVTAQAWAFPSSITTDTYGRLTSVTAGTAPVTSVTGTTNQIGSTGGSTPVISIASDPIIPGTGSITLPSGTTGQRPGSPVNGMLRYNTSNTAGEIYLAGWSTINTSAASVTSVGLSTSSVGITLGGTNPVTGSGTISVDLNADLNALAALSTTGYVSRTGSATYSPRSIVVGSANLTVSNGDGVAGNTSLDLNTTLVGLTAVTSTTLTGTTTVGGNISITGNVISATSGGINITPAGSSSVALTSASQAVALRFHESGGGNYVAFRAGVLSADTTWTLPLADSAGFFSSNGSGTMSITAAGQANTIIVSKSGNDSTGARGGFPFLTITAALSATGITAGDVILVYPGTYSEGQLSPIDGVSIVGVDRNTCIIANTSTGTAINVGSSSRIENLTLTQQNTTTASLTITGVNFKAGSSSTSRMSRVSIVMTPVGGGTSTAVRGIQFNSAGTTLAPNVTDCTIRIIGSSLTASPGSSTVTCINAMNGNSVWVHNSQLLVDTSAVAGQNGYGAVTATGSGCNLLLSVCDISATTADRLITSGSTLVFYEVRGTNNVLIDEGGINVGTLTLGAPGTTSSTISSSATIPDITIAPITTGALILKNSTNAVPIKFYNSAGTQYVGLVAGTLATDTTFTLPTTAGSASQFLQTNGTAGTPTLTFASAVTSVGLSTTSAGITLGGTNPVTTTGTISVDLDSDLNALAALSTTGIVSRTGSATYSLRTITGTASNISLTNGDGVSGNPTVDLIDTAVTAGSYISLNATIDAKGRITSASSGSPSAVSNPLYNKEIITVSAGYNSGSYGSGAPGANLTMSAASTSVFDTTTVNANSKAFEGACFDGRYIYMMAGCQAATASGQVTRYDTYALTGFSSSSSYSVFDTTTVNSNSKGFSGCVFDGVYVYFVPFKNGVTAPNGLFGQITRYDTRLPFTSASSYSVFDSQTVNSDSCGFQGAVFDGKYIYFVPNLKADNSTRSGIILRYDTTASTGFTSSSSYAVFDSTTVQANSKGFQGAIFDGQYIYFVPHGAGAGTSGSLGQITRYDTQAATGFTSSSSYAVFNLTTVSASAVGFEGAVFDRRYIYFVPFGSAGVIARYDTQASTGFTSASSYAVFDATTVNANSKTFFGGVYDGKYIYFIPGLNTSGLVTRYNTELPFTSASSYSVYDTTGVNANSMGFSGGIYDGRFVYLIPYKYSSTFSGQITRLVAYSGSPATSVGLSTTSGGITLGGTNPVTTNGIISVDLDADLNALAALSTTGLVSRTGSATYSPRTITTTSGGITLGNADGVSGNPSIDLDADLNAVAALSTTGLVSRTGSATYSPRTITSTSAGITLGNADGVAGNPSIDLDADLNALAALSTTGYVSRTGSATYSPRSIVVGSANLTVSNGNGVSGNTSLDLATTITGLTSITSVNIVGTTDGTFSNIKISSVGLTTTGSNQSIGLRPNGTGAVVIEEASGGVVPVQFTGTLGAYVALKAGAVPVSYTLTLPTADASGTFVSNGSGAMSIFTRVYGSIYVNGNASSTATTSTPAEVTGLTWTLDSDTIGMTNSTSYRLLNANSTVSPRKFLVTFTSTVATTGVAVTARDITIEIRKNGSALSKGSSCISTPALNLNGSFSISCFVSLATNDYLSVFASTSGAAAAIVISNANLSVTDIRGT